MLVTNNHKSGKTAIPLFLRKLLPQFSLIHWSFSLGIALTLFLSSSARSEDNINVTVNPWGEPMVNEFDPNKEPGEPADPEVPGDLPGPPVDGDGKSLIEPEEDGVALPSVELDFNANLAEGEGGKITITSINITTSGQTTIYLPSDADDKLKKHERGHDTLSEEEYTQRVERKMKDSVRKLIGNMYQGEGDTLEEKLDDAEAQANKAINDEFDKVEKAIKKQMDTLGEKYDQLTDHGKSETVDTDEGVEEAKKERDKAAKAGEKANKPDESKPIGATAPDPARVFFDSSTNSLSFGGDLLLTFTNDPADPIIDRGEVQVEPMLLIGVQENGTIHLSDTSLQIIDTINDDFLMDAFLFEVAYMPSSLPGFAGMIQAYLDIPPEFAGGINNSIGSDFLSGMLEASVADEPTTFWFYADEPLFDSQGLPLIGINGVTGSLKMGIAQVPESTPTFSLLAIAGLGAGSTLLRNHKKQN